MNSQNDSTKLILVCRTKPLLEVLFMKQKNLREHHEKKTLNKTLSL